MRKQEIYHYYVEGEDEKKLLEVLKRDTIVVLIYDTDVEDGLDILQYNVNFLNKQKGIKQVICIPQVKNLEEELVHACSIKTVTELTKSDSKTNYKRDLINCNNLADRLTACGFNLSKFWSRTPTNRFKKFGNGAKKIKIS